MDSTYAGAYGNLGNVYLTMEKFDRAEEAYRRAMTLDPEDPDVHQNLASLYMKKGLQEEARKEIALYERLKKGQ